MRPHAAAPYAPLRHSLQVLTALDAFKASPPAAEADLAPVQTLINEAYQGAPPRAAAPLPHGWLHWSGAATPCLLGCPCLRACWCWRCVAADHARLAATHRASEPCCV